MLRTASEIQQDLAGRIKARRIAMGLRQIEAAERAGVAYRTWRRTGNPRASLAGGRHQGRDRIAVRRSC